jgi:hypothetical protein
MQPTAETTAEVPVEPEITTTPTDDSAYLRIAHFAPDAASVDAYLNGNIAVRNLNYPSASRWFAVDPGTYTMAVAASGQTANDTLIDPFDVTASAGTWQTVAVIGSTASGTLQASVIAEDYSDLLPSTGSFTFVNALEGSPPVNLVRDGVVFFAQVGSPGQDAALSSSLLVDAGIFDVSVTAGDDPAQVFAERTGLELPENAYTLVALIGTLGDSRLFVLTTDRSEVQIVRGLLPKPGQLLDALRANENLTAFADTLESTGLSDLLSGDTEYTILAPANFAFDDSAAMTAEQQAEALRGYIVEGKFTSIELVDAGTLTALDGSTLNVTTDANGIFINNVQVIDVNIPATNGVIHMLNGLLNQAS